MNKTTDSIPPVEPKSSTPSKPKTKAKAKGANTIIDGSSLSADLDGPLKGSLSQYYYWVGVLPTCPVESVDIAGINFPKLNENVIDDPSRTGRSRRVPVIGSITILTEDKIRLLREKLPRQVVRFLDGGAGAGGAKEETGTGQNLGDLHVRPRKGYMVRIPTDQQIKERRERGRSSRHYVRQKGDEPAAKYIFAMLCEDQDKPDRGDFYPDPLEVTGLEWPEKIED